MVQIADCSEVWPEPSDVWLRGYTLLILTSTYLLPLTVLSITYGLVITKLWRRRAPGNADSARDSQQLKSKRRVSVKFIITAPFTRFTGAQVWRQSPQRLTGGT